MLDNQDIQIYTRYMTVTYIKDDLGPEEDVQEASKCQPHQ